MRRAALLAATAALVPIAACGSPSRQASPQPTVTVTAPPAASPSRRPVDFDDLNKNEACFDLGTYQGAKRDSDPKTHTYAVDAQKVAGEVGDPEWSALADMPAAKAMRRLAALCKEINYHE